MKKESVQEKNIKINIFGKISNGFINQFQLTVLVILLLISMGISGLINLPKESLPEIVFPSLTIQTVFPGASPEDVEYLVTEKIENKINDFSDISQITSETTFGFSVVSVEYLEGVDIDQKKIEVDNALKELIFSDGVQTPRSFVFSTSEIPLMNISVVGDYPLDELTMISKDIANEIEGIRGIDAVKLSGEVTREIEVVTNELAMMKYNINFSMLQQALAAQNFSAPIGEVALNGVRYNLRVDERYKTIEDIEKTSITQNITIGDVAEVVDGLEPIESYSRTYFRDADTPLPSIFLTVTRKVGSDVIGTSDDVKSAIETMAGNVYPRDLRVEVSNDLAVNVQNDLDKIQGSAWSGLIVVILVLFLFIGIKESIIVSITIPLSLLGTLGVLNLFGITFNTFAILGLIVALGLLVDNSIIVMENIDRLKKKGLSAKEASFYGTNQVGFPIFSSTFTTLAAFLPLAILPGILGAFISTIPITIMITITVSLMVSLVITPSIASKILNTNGKSLPKVLKYIVSIGLVAVLSYFAFKDIGGLVTLVMTSIFVILIILKLLFVGESGLEETGLTRRYSKVIRWLSVKKYRGFIFLLSGFAVLIGSFTTFGFGLLKISFFPSGEPTALTIKIDTAGGMTLSDTDKVVQDVEALLMNQPAVTQFNTTIGGTEQDLGVVSVELDTAYDGFEVLNEIDNQLKLVPGALISTQTVIAGPPVGKPVEIQIIGDDLKESVNFSSQVLSQLGTIDGVYNIESSTSQGVPQLLVDINAYKGLEYGVTPFQVTNQLRGEMNGVVASTIRSNQEEIDIVIRKDLDMIDSIEDVENLFIATPASNMLTLSALAQMETENGISNITRKDGNRVITLTADLKSNYNINDVVDQLKATFRQSDLPTGININYEGDVAGIEQNFGNLFQSMILAIFLVFIILTLQFKSLKQPFIILTTIPMALIGVIWGLIVTGNDFGFYAFMGLVALVGIAVNDAIVLIDYINYLKDRGRSLVDAITEAGKTRFNPVLATTLTTISGVLPLAFKEAYYAQFSYALIFGLMVTTFLTLFFIPVLYSLFHKEEVQK